MVTRKSHLKDVLNTMLKNVNDMEIDDDFDNFYAMTMAKLENNKIIAKEVMQ